MPGKLVGKDDQEVVKTLVDLSEKDASLLQQTAVETVKEWKGGMTRAEIVSARK